MFKHFLIQLKSLTVLTIQNAVQRVVMEHRHATELVSTAILETLVVLLMRQSIHSHATPTNVVSNCQVVLAKIIDT